MRGVFMCYAWVVCIRICMVAHRQRVLGHVFVFASPMNAKNLPSHMESAEGWEQHRDE